MKTIGLIGGTGWVSTIEYYRQINQKTTKVLGGLNSAKCLIYSFNFGEIVDLQESDKHESVYAEITVAANNLIQSGADCIALCANTMHRYAEKLENEINVPLIHIAKSTAMAIDDSGISKVGLLGTRLTMELDFYSAVLEQYNIEVLTPDIDDREVIHSIIFDELVKNEFKERSRKLFLDIFDVLERSGAQGIVLGCTEIPLLIEPGHTRMPLFNTLDLHTSAIVNYTLSDHIN